LQAQSYAGGITLVHNISTGESLKTIKRAKANQELDISVACLNLIYDEGDVADFDINLKVSPPLRTSQDKKALVKAVQNGDINIITAQHRPLSKEEKDQPFGLAMHGASTLETVFQSLHTHTDLSLERILHCLSVGPHRALDMPCPEIKVDAPAYLTIVDPSTSPRPVQLVSKGVNNPFEGKTLPGSVLGVVRGKAMHLNH